MRHWIQYVAKSQQKQSGMHFSAPPWRGQCQEHCTQKADPAYGRTAAQQRTRSAIGSHEQCSISGRRVPSCRRKRVNCRTSLSTPHGPLCCHCSAFNRAAHVHPASGVQRNFRRRGRRRGCRAQAMSSSKACRVLGVDSTCSRGELRAAYLARIKEVSSSFVYSKAVP